RWNGFAVTGLYGLGEAASGNLSNVGLHANYVSGGLTAVLSAQRVRTPVTAPLSEQKATLLGAAYDFKVATVFGAHVRTEAEGTHNTTHISSLGVRVPVSHTDAVMAEWSRAHRDAAAATTRNTSALGYDHVLSQRTNVYVVYGRDRLSGRDTGNSYAVGIRHSF
ncbi:MAG: porin, partial [Frankiales bacterium]|nr:porin [Frankiales bacterium]